MDGPPKRIFKTTLITNHLPHSAPVVKPWRHSPWTCLDSEKEKCYTPPIFGNHFSALEPAGQTHVSGGQGPTCAFHGAQSGEGEYSMAQFCTKCGSPQTEGMRFCANCGAIPVSLQRRLSKLLRRPWRHGRLRPGRASSGSRCGRSGAGALVGKLYPEVRLGCLGICIIFGLLMAGAGA